jgi:hypothetical protein
MPVFPPLARAAVTPKLTTLSASCSHLSQKASSTPPIDQEFFFGRGGSHYRGRIRRAGARADADQGSRMSNPYGEIFRVPGAMGFSAAAFVARMPVAMMPIGIVTMLSQLRGEYWLAGGVAATFTLANAIVAPQISRLVDRLGQSRLLTPATAIAVLRRLPSSHSR